MAKVRVLHIIKSLGRGGAETLLPETLRVHDRSQFEFHYIYFLPLKNALVSSIEVLGCPVTCVAASNNISLLLKWRTVLRYVRDNKIDLIHAHLPWAGFVARLVGGFSKVPVLYTEHNKQERYHWVTRFLNLATINFQRLVIAVSDDVANSIAANKRALKRAPLVIKNGINTDNFNKAVFVGEDARQELGIPKDALVIGTVAVFRVQKRLELWLDVAASILKEFPNAYFVLVGDGPLKGTLERKARDSGLHGRVRMPGLKTEVRPYFSAFDIYLMTSEFEGLPLALLEAMSMECAVVSTDAGGIKEVLRDSENGMMVPVDRPYELLAAVRSVIQEGKQARLGKAARATVIANYSVQRMVEELEMQYKSIVST